MYGTCDDWQVEFTYIGEGLWQCSVPIDITDGQYACKFYAVDMNGDIGFWCGVLYISSGKVCLKIDDDPIEFFFVSEGLSFEISMNEHFDIVPETHDFSFFFQNETLGFNILRGCCDG